MKHILLIFSVLLSFWASAQQPDSAKTAELGRRLAEYYGAIERESIDVQKRECDFLIETVSDSLLKQFVALDIYAHYKDSPLMGAENVAVHVFDRWFAPGIIKMKSYEDFVVAEVFAGFNRMSLIGETAPELLMETLEGDVSRILGSEGPDGRMKVLYFYDVDCPKCRIETMMLSHLFSEHRYPVDVYAIYVGDNDQEWKQYVSDHIKIRGAKHFWDPKLESDFQRKYGVVRTPRLFLIGPDNVILGRGLDVRALETLLDSITAERSLEYGGRESVSLFDGIFSSSGGKPTAGQVKGIADYIHDRTLVAGDTLMFRQMAGDYLYYLSSLAGEGSKEGLRYHIDKNILSQNVWRTHDDSLKVVGFARIMSDLLSRAMPGTRISDIKVPGELYTCRGSKGVDMRLDRLRGDVNIIMFVTEGCDVCAAQKKLAQTILGRAHDKTLSKAERAEARNTVVFIVSMDEIMASSPSLATRLMDAFDLSSLPFIIMTERDGTILRRYLSLDDL